MKVALYARPVKDNIPAYINTLIELQEKQGVGLIIQKDYAIYLDKQFGFHANIPEFSSYEELKTMAPDYLLCLGGDGTILETLDYIRDTGIPVLGVNTGRLGFLASVSKEDYAGALDKLMKKEFTLDARALLQLHKPGHLFELNTALNECTLVKKDSSTMMTIDVDVDGMFVNSYWADGLIISTPTGSTAYSLSCGGPLMEPNSASLIITPIAPHNLNVRPMVIDDKSEIRLKIRGRGKQHLISLDSRQATIQIDEEVLLKKAGYSFNLINLNGQNFFNTLRNKLMWGADKRN